MQKTFARVAGNISKVDCVIEVLDARIPASSSSSVLRRLSRSKERMVILNKSDLADPTATASWVDYFVERGHLSGPMYAHSAKDGDKLREMLSLAKERKFRALGLREVRHASFRVMVAGVPNVGKSAIVNLIAGATHAPSGAKPGLTRGQQWVHTRDGIELLDTPGVFIPDISRKPQNSPYVLKLGLCGILPETLYLAQIAAGYLNQITGGRAFAALLSGASIDTPGDAPEAMAAGLLEIARKRGFLLPGGELDVERAARLVVHEFGKGSLGRFTLELPEDDG